MKRISLLTIFFILGCNNDPIINNKSVDNIVLKLPTCKGVKPIKDFFIRMYELPHNKDSINK